MKKKKILISITAQFGYHTDTYKYCEYLDKSKYEISYIGFDLGKARFEIDDVRVVYIPTNSNKIKQYLTYIYSVTKEIRSYPYDIFFQVDCQATFLIRLLNLNQRTILDIRTGDLHHSNFKRNYSNFFIWFTSLFYRKISIISNSLREKLRISKQKSSIIPLGADITYAKGKDTNKISLFYIGDITDRRIDETVSGLGKYMRENRPTFKINYDIVGFGSTEKVELLKKTISDNNLEDVVKFHGHKNHREARTLFENSTIGVVYVPITSWFDCQPTTKLYECLLAGMPVIATSTKENSNDVTPTSGVLIKDNPDSFCEGLRQIIKNKTLYHSEQIISQYRKSTWEYIVKNILEPYLDKTLEK